MKRVRQESAEVYEVSPAEIALALGLYLMEGDTVTLEHKYGDKHRLTIKSVENEDIDIEAPVHDPIGLMLTALSGGLVLVADSDTDDEDGATG